MGKIKDLFYKVTRGSEALKPNDLGPAKKLAEPVAVKVQVVKATVGTNPGCACGGSCGCGGKKKAVTDAELKAHLAGEGFVEVKTEAEVKPKAKAAYTSTVKKEAVKKAPVKKAPAKVTEKKIAIAKDLADTPVKPVAKKPAPKKRTGPGNDRAE